MLIVSELYIYPVKSLGGIKLESSQITDRGLQYDRRWMLVDGDNQFMTQRQHPEMALLNTSIHEEKLVIKNRREGQTPLIIPIQPASKYGDIEKVQIWSNRCKAIMVSKYADEWLSHALSANCRLVFMPDETKRRVDGRYAHDKEITSFSDAFPFMMLGQSSLDDLNSRLTEALPINRFRPNIVFSGGQPYEEDSMEQLTIAGNQFLGAKLCGRCVITTINQQTALMDKEPLKTLATYRKKNNKIYFGQNLLSRGEGMIQVGDKIDIIKRKQ